MIVDHISSSFSKTYVCEEEDGPICSARLKYQPKLYNSRPTNQIVFHELLIPSQRSVHYRRRARGHHLKKGNAFSLYSHRLVGLLTFSCRELEQRWDCADLRATALGCCNDTENTAGTQEHMTRCRTLRDIAAHTQLNPLE